MKQLLNGVAIAAVLTLAAPALAQNLTSPPPAAPAPAPSAAPAPASNTGAAEPMAKKPVRHRVHHVAKKSGDPEGDQMTQQLNRQVLDHTGGAPPPMPESSEPPPGPGSGPKPGPSR
jgi:hypothetical protein